MPTLQNRTLTLALVALLCALPVIIYFFFLWKWGLNLPWADDFICFFYPLNSDLPVWKEIFLWQNGDYRVVFQKAVAFITPALFGDLNFKGLLYFSNLALIGIAFLLARIVKDRSLLAIIPIFFLLFNFKFFEDTYWVLTGLVVHWLILKILLMYVFLAKAIKENSTKFLWLALLMGALATFSSANGFFAMFTALPCLLYDRKKLFLWLSMTILIVFVYMIGYEPRGEPMSLALNHSVDVIKTILAFTAGVFNVGPFGVQLSLVMGAVVFIGFAYLTLNQYFKKNPLLYGFLGFLLLTAIAIGLKRTVPGSEIPIPLIKSRYLFWSTLVIISAYLIILDYVKAKRLRLFLIGSIIFSVGFFAQSYQANWGFAKSLHQNIIRGYVEYKLNPESGLLTTVGDAKRMRHELTEGMRKGFYQMPPLNYAAVSSKKYKGIDTNLELPKEVLPIIDFEHAVVDEHLLVKGYFGNESKWKGEAVFMIWDYMSDQKRIYHYQMDLHGNHHYTNEDNRLAVIPVNELEKGDYLTYVLDVSAGKVNAVSSPFAVRIP